jgi:hypothetical protein
MLSLAYSKMNRHARGARRRARSRSISCKGDEACCIDALGRRAAAHAALRRMRQPRSPIINAALEYLKAAHPAACPPTSFKQDFNHAQQYIYSQAIALQVQQKHGARALEAAELCTGAAHFLDLSPAAMCS